MFEGWEPNTTGLTWHKVCSPEVVGIIEWADGVWQEKISLRVPSGGVFKEYRVTWNNEPVSSMRRAMLNVEAQASCIKRNLRDA